MEDNRVTTIKHTHNAAVREDEDLKCKNTRGITAQNVTGKKWTGRTSHTRYTKNKASGTSRQPHAGTEFFKIPSQHKSFKQQNTGP